MKTSIWHNNSKGEYPKLPVITRVASEKTHCKPFELPIPEQWVFG